MLCSDICLLHKKKEKEVISSTYYVELYTTLEHCMPDQIRSGYNLQGSKVTKKRKTPWEIILNSFHIILFEKKTRAVEKDTHMGHLKFTAEILVLLENTDT